MCHQVLPARRATRTDAPLQGTARGGQPEPLQHPAARPLPVPILRQRARPHNRWAGRRSCHGCRSWASCHGCRSSHWGRAAAWHGTAAAWHGTATCVVAHGGTCEARQEQQRDAQWLRADPDLTLRLLAPPAGLQITWCRSARAAATRGRTWSPAAVSWEAWWHSRGAQYCRAPAIYMRGACLGWAGECRGRTRLAGSMQRRQQPMTLLAPPPMSPCSHLQLQEGRQEPGAAALEAAAGAQGALTGRGGRGGGAARRRSSSKPH